jgi:Pregnancy-associated plasma protein-A/Secretion system C-terminal sorting domain
MKHLFTFFIVPLLLFLAPTQGLAQAEKHDHHKECGADEYLQQAILKDPSLKAKIQMQEAELQKYLSKQEGKMLPTTITIPVVIHVLYYKDFWGAEVGNTTDVQIANAMSTLNADYGGTNGLSGSIPTVFQSLNAGNTGIQFCLAKRDPNNNPHSGIIKKLVTKVEYRYDLDDAKKPTLQGDAAWDSQKYLNVWIVPKLYDTTGINRQQLNGYATFPGTVANYLDGVVIDYNKFGWLDNTVNMRYRTFSHEVGHWLNVKHIFGTNNCNDDDVADTPIQSASSGCPSFPSVSCNNGANGSIFMNVMDYSTCRHMFTVGQESRMWAAINTTRNALFSATACLSPANLSSVSSFAGGTVYSVSFGPTSLPNRANKYELRYRTIGDCSNNAGSWIIWASNITGTSYSNSTLPNNKRIEMQVRDMNDPMWSPSVRFNTRIAPISTSGSSFSLNNPVSDQSITDGTSYNTWTTPNPTDTYSFWGAGDMKISMYSDNSNMGFYVYSSLNPSNTYGQMSIEYYGGFYSYTTRLAQNFSSGPYFIKTTGLGNYVMRLEKCSLSSALNIGDAGDLQTQFIASDKDTPFSIYPNPANTEIVVQIAEITDDQTIEIIDITGKTIKTTLVKDNFTTINTDEINSGMYLIRTNINGVSTTKKLIINH